MKAQTRAAALRESIMNVLVGFAIQWIASYFVLPLFGMHPSIRDLFGIGAIFTVISVARSYLLRRVFERVRASDVPPDFQHIIEDLARERHRQISGEGYDLAHDDEHTRDDLALGAAAYAIAGIQRWGNDGYAERMAGTCWPWAPGVFKPTTRRRNLIKAGAMIIAEIGRLDRATGRKRRPG